MGPAQVVKLATSLFLAHIFSTMVECSFDPFMDSKLFTIQWKGELNLNNEEVDQLGDRHVVITTTHQEKYRCILPETLKNTQNEASSYTGPSEEELMQPLFKETRCSYRIESYWTYELCHGRHLKQYHETKDQGMEPKVQEYYLGFGNHRDSLKDADGQSEATGSAPPLRLVDGAELPYFEVIMSDGTKCDLTGQPRKAHVQYICHTEGVGEVYELKETSSCEYEVVVLVSLLCGHPKYRPKTQPVNEIKCHAMHGSPLRPTELTQQDLELRYMQEAGQDYFTTETNSEVRETKRKPKLIRKTETVAEVEEPKVEPPNLQAEVQSQLGAVTAKQTLRDFISGGHCLTGGTGWWKHELCFGNFVKQYHKERGREINIFLGYWDKEQHLAWLQENPHKRPRPLDSKKIVSLYYSNGDMCDLTGKPRTCEVKLKCQQSNKNPHAIVLSLSEPESCQYVLTVESALFCSVLKDVDENGLFEGVEL